MTALVVAASLLFILGVAAVAIDGGRGWSERRQSQSGADFGAIAALQAAVSCPSTCLAQDAADAGAAEAMQVVQQNFPGVTFDWTGCSDPGALPLASSTTPCISFDGANFARSRVVLPDHDISASFGRALGVDVLTTSALAEAGQTLGNRSRVIPFAAGAGTHACLFSNQAPQTVPPCDGPTQGNFGYLDIAIFGNAELGTSEDCGGSNPLFRLGRNIAIGSDHSIVPKDALHPAINDFDACPNLSEDVNQLEVQPGAPLGPTMEDGLIFGVTGPTAPGRLACAGGGAPCVTIRGTGLNDRPLWSYLAPGACATTPSDRADMVACLDAFDPAIDPPMFTDAIADQKRFAYAPKFNPYPAGNGAYFVESLIPVYLETLYADCTAISCKTVFSPGESGSAAPACPDPLDGIVSACGYGLPGTWNSKLEGITALVLHPAMLPASVRADAPGSAGFRDFALTR